MGLFNRRQSRVTEVTDDQGQKHNVLAQIEVEVPSLEKVKIEDLRLELSEVRTVNGKKMRFLESHAFAERSKDGQRWFNRTTIGIMGETMVNQKRGEQTVKVPTLTLNGMNRMPAKPDDKPAKSSKKS